MVAVFITKAMISTHYDSEYERRTFMGTVPSLRYGKPDRIDPLDPRLLNIFKGRVPYEEVIYRGEPITTIAHDNYLTTTPWWLIVMFNGYLNAQDIPDGTKLRVPSLAYIRNRLTRNTQTQRGTIVTV